MTTLDNEPTFRFSSLRFCRGSSRKQHFRTTGNGAENRKMNPSSSCQTPCNIKYIVYQSIYKTVCTSSVFHSNKQRDRCISLSVPPALLLLSLAPWPAGPAANEWPYNVCSDCPQQQMLGSVCSSPLQLPHKSCQAVKKLTAERYQSLP